jgi:hypothetical protein
MMHGQGLWPGDAPSVDGTFTACYTEELSSEGDASMGSVIKKRRKKMRKHKHKKLRSRMRHKNK